MSLLFRYIFSRHAKLLLLTLSVGMSLYLLTDLLERVDSFVEQGSSLTIILGYFCLRMPAIAAQILPAVFVLASVITLCLMARNRESMALEAGGVTPTAVLKVLLICGLFWGLVQFACSQFFGVQGQARAEHIWLEEVKHVDTSSLSLQDLWFTEGNWIVSTSILYQDGHGSGFNAYELSDDGLRFLSIVRAPSFWAEDGNWHVAGASRFYPDSFRMEDALSVTLPIGADHRLFFVAGQEKPQNQPLWLLSEAIEKLRNSGSNVEVLQTAWHSRISYAASLIVMAVLAMAIVSWKNNIYLALTLTIAVTFVFYVLTVTSQTMGEKGLLPPLAAAWGPQLLLLAVASLRLTLVNLRRE